MSMPERDTVYTTDRSTRPVYTRESSATGWFVGIVVALALLAIGYLIFAANTTMTTTPAGVEINNTPTVEAPATTPASPMVETPATGTETTPMAPATETAPVETAPVETAPADAAPATEAPAPVEAPAQ